MKTRLPLALVAAVLPVLGMTSAAPVAAQDVGAAPAASPSPTPTVHADYACPHVVATVSSTGRIGDVVTIGARMTFGPPDSRLILARELPGPAAVVRTASDTSTAATFTVRLGETHRFRVDAVPGRGCGIVAGRPAFLTVPVRPELSLDAVRTSPRTYTFSGRVLPGRGQQVSLFRTDQGRKVLTASTVVRPDGTYSITRRFSGTGRFGFSVAVRESATNSAGTSRTRPTLVH